MDEALNDLGQQVAQAFSADVSGFSVALGELRIDAQASAILRLLTYLRDEPSCLFQQLIDITAVDWPERPRR